jgi:hypothetical protein
MKTRIISLGEIITPNIMKTIHAFTALIVNHKPDSNPAQVGAQVGGVLQTQKTLIDDLKHGAILEAQCVEQIISALEKATEVKLSLEEFYDAWNAMCPHFKEFEQFLRDAIEFNRKKNHSAAFISATNPIDIRFIVKQLAENKVAYQYENDQLLEIEGIPLFTTYSLQMPKAALIEHIVKLHLSKAGGRSALASSMDDVFKSTTTASDIKYIRGVNKIDDPVLSVIKTELDQTNQDIEQKAASLQVEVVIWKKWEKQSLLEALNTNDQSPRYLHAVNL